jgi:hypothetical protein
MPDNPDDGGRGSELAALVLAFLVAGAAGVYQPVRPPQPTGAGGRPTGGGRFAAAGLAAPATPTLAPTTTATPSPTPTTAAVTDGVVVPPPPFFSFRRPFDPPAEVAPSRFYPYATTAGGAYILHHGIDIGNPMGTPVQAVGDGTVVYAGGDSAQAWGQTTDFYGNLVVLEHPARMEGRPLYSLYGHLSEVGVRAGQRVASGEEIGRVGMAGIALGPHLHLEFRTAAEDYEATRNPELLLQPLAGHGTVVGRVVDRADQSVGGVDVALFATGPDGADSWRVGSKSYPPEHVNRTQTWQENFLFADTPAGRYRVRGQLDGLSASQPVTVTDGGVVRVTLRLDRG